MAGMNLGNWGALLQGGIQGEQTEQNMKGKALQNQYYKDALVDPASQANAYWTQQGQQNSIQNGQTPWRAPTGLEDPVHHLFATTLPDVYKTARAKLSSFLPGQGQHASGPSSQSTVPQGSNVAMSRPQPTSSNPAAGGLPGASGPMPLPQTDAQVSQPRPYADGGIPGRGGALRMRKAKPGNVAKPTKVAQAAMHPPMEKAPVDAQEMGAEGGPPRNTEAQPSNQDPMLANGGTVDKIPPFKSAIPPKPVPSMVEKDVSNDGQRNRLGKTIKKFADGTPPGKAPPAGLEPAEAAPESVLQHLSKTAKGAYNDVANTPIAKAAGEALSNPAGVGIGLGQQAVQGVGNWLSSPWNESQTPKPQAGAPAPKAPAPPMQGPPSPRGDANQGSPPADVMDGRDHAHAIPARVISPRDADYAQAHGGMLPDGTQAGAYVVDTQGEQAGGMSPYTASGSPSPTHTAGPSLDFSQVNVNHKDLPDVPVENWDKLKQGIITQLVQTRQAGPEQAALLADDKVSSYQHQNFMQYLQQGAALDAAGNKEGAMAAYKTAYNYMPTGHAMDFGVTNAPQKRSDGSVVPAGTIVGYGRDEKTHEPVGSPVLLDQDNVNRLASTFQDPKNFQSENIAMMEQRRKNLETTQGQVPYMRAHAGLANATAGFYGNRLNTQEDVAHIRADAMVAARANRLPPDVSLKVNSALRASGIIDPNDQFAATGVASHLMAQGRNQADATAIAGMMYAPGVDPARRAAMAQQYGIPLMESENPMAGNTAIPPR